MDLTIAMQAQSSLSEASTGAAAGGAAASPTSPPSPPQDLVDKFESMMAEGSPTQPAKTNGADNLVTKAVDEQASDYRQVPNDVMYMSQHMDSMSMQRLASADMTVQLEIASLSADLQVKMAAVQSSKDAVQTLMKNQ